jgi:acetyltransferase-like isoleucine patch superfamily enzyme
MTLSGIPGLREDEVSRIKFIGAGQKLRLEGPRLARGLVVGRRATEREKLRADAGARVIRVSGEIHFGRFVLLGRDSCVGVFGDNPRALLSIGERTSIGARTRIDVGLQVTIGANCHVAPDCQLTDGDFHDILDETGAPLGPRNKPLVIEDHVWIATRTIVLKGVRIGAGSIIGAGSVVTRDVPSGSLAAGNPARVIRTVAGWH